MKHTRIHPRHLHGAFTLVEMLLVLGIIGLLVGVGVVSFGGVLEGGRNKTALGHINQIQSAARAYEVDTMKLPTTAQGISILVEKGKLKKMPLDPWDHPYNYRKPGVKDKGGFDVFSSGPDGIPDNADDIGSWQL
ncbi:MAG: type II secretion system protein GspG [Verrucomicrobiaceae bacterium]